MRFFSPFGARKSPLSESFSPSEERPESSRTEPGEAPVDPLLDLLRVELPPSGAALEAAVALIRSAREPRGLTRLLIGGQESVRHLVARYASLSALDEEGRSLIHGDPTLLTLFAARPDLDPIALRRAVASALHLLPRLVLDPAEAKTTRVLGELESVLAQVLLRGEQFSSSELRELVMAARTPHVQFDDSWTGCTVAPSPAARLSLKMLTQARGLTAEMLISLFVTHREDAAICRSLVLHPDAGPELWLLALHRAEASVKADIARLPAARSDERCRKNLLDSWQHEIIQVMFTEYPPEILPKRFEQLAKHHPATALEMLEKHAGHCGPHLEASHLAPLLEHRDSEIRLRAITAMSLLRSGAGEATTPEIASPSPARSR